MKRFLGVIVGRAGSKRLPGKHLRLLGGKPLLSWTLEAALSAKRLDKAILSTDGEKMAALARSHGLDVPFMRPPELAADTSLPLDTLRHALEFCMRRGEEYDAVVLLQATSPFRAGLHIDEAIALFLDTGADTVTSVRPAREHAYYQFTLEENRMVPFFSGGYALARHDLPRAYLENGAVYVLSVQDILSGVFYGSKVCCYHMDEDSSVDIDTEEDLRWAEFTLAKQNNDAV